MNAELGSRWLAEHPHDITGLQRLMQRRERGIVTSLPPLDIGVIPHRNRLTEYFCRSYDTILQGAYIQPVPGAKPEVFNKSQQVWLRDGRPGAEDLLEMTAGALDNAREFYHLYPDEPLFFKTSMRAGKDTFDNLATHEPHVDSCYDPTVSIARDESELVRLAGLFYLGLVEGLPTEWRAGEAATADESVDGYFYTTRLWKPAEPLANGHMGRGYLDLSIHNSPLVNGRYRGLISISIPVPKRLRLMSEPSRDRRWF